MRANNDLARQRLTHFLAARLNARHREVNEIERADPGSCSSKRPRPDRCPGEMAEDVDSSSTSTPLSEHGHDPGTPAVQ
jgi:hypothetical protein